MKSLALPVALVGLAVLHHDFWLWDDGQLVFGFLPTGLAYHAGFSLLTALVWLAAALRAWPGESHGAPGPPDGDGNR